MVGALSRRSSVACVTEICMLYDDDLKRYSPPALQSYFYGPNHLMYTAVEADVKYIMCFWRSLMAGLQLYTNQGVVLYSGVELSPLACSSGLQNK